MSHQAIMEATQHEIQGQLVHIGDSRNMSPVADESVNFFITSPPYWDLKNYGTSAEIGQSSYERYLDDLAAVWAECYRCAAANAVLVVNVNNRRVRKQFYPIAMDIASRMQGWELWDHVIWYIPNALPQPNHYMERLLDNKYESCLVFTKNGCNDYKFHKPRVPQKYLSADPRSHKRNSNGRCVGNILRIPAYRPPNVKKLGYHVAAFPEELVAFFLECYTDEHDIVLDPFAGSGTTLKVCRVMNRKGIGFELNESYAPLIEQRIAEDWAVPAWTDIDIIHSATSQTGMSKPRKIQYLKQNGSQVVLTPFHQTISSLYPFVWVLNARKRRNFDFILGAKVLKLGELLLRQSELGAQTRLRCTDNSCLPECAKLTELCCSS